MLLPAYPFLPVGIYGLRFEMSFFHLQKSIGGNFNFTNWCRIRNSGTNLQWLLQFPICFDFKEIGLRVGKLIFNAGLVWSPSATLDGWMVTPVRKQKKKMPTGTLATSQLHSCSSKTTQVGGLQALPQHQSKLYPAAKNCVCLMKATQRRGGLSGSR